MGIVSLGAGPEIRTDPLLAQWNYGSALFTRQTFYHLLLSGFLVLLARSLLVSVRRLPFPVFIFFNFYDNDRQNAHMLSLILIFSGFVLVRLQELGEARSQAQQAHFSRVYNMKKFGSFAFSVTSLRGKPPLAMNF
ncbi:hypothetical protein L484_000426 [Morus notabilis]|uniref:Uncharacterized protein n=1 Tax=Morus notabilis TaxID=981085 RepID=W9SNQ9_9ROSA|nr:hypothetical protein L484_000426 [Morus notabilis]